MSDALASHAVAQEAAVLRCHCLAHGRRKVSDLVEVFPHACQVVLEVISAVCDHDEQARLASPQAPRPPLMDGRKRWLARQMADHLVEPNRALGKAMVDRQKPWATWTQFFSVPGAPLDHNLAERALKLFLRQRNHSLFSQHEPSASMASILTSLSAPACMRASRRWSPWWRCKSPGARWVRRRQRGCPGRMPAAGPRLTPPAASRGPSGRARGCHATAHEGVRARTGAPVRPDGGAPRGSGPARVSANRTRSPGRQRGRV